MLDKPIDEIVMENGKVVGVKSGEEVAKCKQVYCDPSYVSEKVSKVGTILCFSSLLSVYSNIRSESDYYLKKYAFTQI